MCQSNIAIGREALRQINSGTAIQNVAVGVNAGYNITSANKSTCIGDGAGNKITTGHKNTAIGKSALGAASAAITGSENIGIGQFVAEKLTSGSQNIVLGTSSTAYNLTTGSMNICIGRQVAYSLTTGSENTYIGSENTAFNATTGSNNTCLGHNARPSAATVSNEITLGNTSVNKFRIPGLTNGVGTFEIEDIDINSNGRLGIPERNTGGSSTTLVATDAGKCVVGGSAGVTVPNGVFRSGDAVTIINNSNSDMTITKSITTMYFAADGTSANRTLSTQGMCTIYFRGSSTAYISGAGLS